MSDLLLPDGMTVEAAAGALNQRFALRERELTETERTFYDTFDGLLQADGLVAAHEKGHFSVNDSHEIPWATPPRRLLAVELAPSPLREVLEPVIGARALLPRAHVRASLRAFDVLDDRRKTVARVILEQPQLAVSDRRTVALMLRAGVIGMRGYDEHLASVRKALERDLGYRKAHRPLAEEAVIAGGGAPEGRSSKPKVQLRAKQPATQAVAAVLSAQWEVIDANLEGTIRDIDAEFLHDFRVAVRDRKSVV